MLVQEMVAVKNYKALGAQLPGGQYLRAEHFRRLPFGVDRAPTDGQAGDELAIR